MPDHGPTAIVSNSIIAARGSKAPATGASCLLSTITAEVASTALVAACGHAPTARNIASLETYQFVVESDVCFPACLSSEPMYVGSHDLIAVFWVIYLFHSQALRERLVAKPISLSRECRRHLGKMTRRWRPRISPSFVITCELQNGCGIAGPQATSGCNVFVQCRNDRIRALGTVSTKDPGIEFTM
ncbi:hypothetical protein KC325_g27 [Hortaea werneckii]|nr:hypothetical protein KC325_g27 [Hortaea werneckii]